MRCRHSELQLRGGGALGVGVVEGSLAILAEVVVRQAAGRRAGVKAVRCGGLMVCLVGETSERGAEKFVRGAKTGQSAASRR